MPPPKKVHLAMPVPPLGTVSRLAAGNALNGKWFKWISAAPMAVLMMFSLAGDRMYSIRPGVAVALPPLMLWAWDRDDDLRFLDIRDTGVAFLAATLTLRGEGVVLTPRRNPLALPDGISRAAVVHVESDRLQPPSLSEDQLRRFVEMLVAVGSEVPHHVLQVDFEAVASQRTFFINAIAALRRRLPSAPLSVTALASWCFNENWIGQLEADEVVPMLFRMGYDGRRLRARLADGRNSPTANCRSSIGVATDELPTVLPASRRVYAFSPRRWTPDVYNGVRARMSQWSRPHLDD
jgi:hypothetical protein